MGVSVAEVAVLIVEDEELVRMDAVDIIASAGFTVYEAGNADEAIRLLEMQNDIGIVFTDVNTPGSMDGVRLANYVRDRWPPIHLIVTSGQVSVNRQEVPNGTAFFRKPYSRDQIANKVREMADAGSAAH
jgi:two-component system, response regulator PdtaR